MQSVQGTTAWVQCRSRSACQRCASGQGCGAGVLGALLGQRQFRVLVPLGQAAGVQPGDQVELGIRESQLLKAAVAAYLWPLSGLMTGAVLAGAAAGFERDLYTAAGAAAGLALAVAWSRRRAGRAGAGGLFRPQLLRNLGPCTGAAPADAGPSGHP